MIQDMAIRPEEELEVVEEQWKDLKLKSDTIGSIRLFLDEMDYLLERLPAPLKTPVRKEIKL